MIISKKTKDNIEIKVLGLSSKKLVQAKCDCCFKFLGRNSEWIRYDKVSKKKKHLCRSCATRKQFGFNQPVYKIKNNKKLKHCVDCNVYKPLNKFYTTKNRCTDCDGKISEEYYKKHKKEIKKRVITYDKKHPEVVKKRRDKYNKTEGKKISQAKWQRSPKGKVSAHNKRVRRQYILSQYSPMTQEMEEKLIEEVKTLFNGEYKCPYCSKLMKPYGKDPNSESWEHFIPLKRVENKDFDIDVNDYNNMTYCCYSCNSSKNDRTSQEYIENFNTPTTKSQKFILKKMNKLLRDNG